MAGQQTDAAAVARELVETFNAADWDRQKEICTPNVTYEEAGTGRRIEGVEEYMELGRQWRAAFPDARGTIHSAVGSGDTAAVEITWAGTQTGALQTANGTIPPTGKRIESKATMWVTTENGRARRVRHHVDIMTMMTQLGAIPAPAQT
ncbi:MAG: ester cyclase [Gemmatimonadaceae bacterium]